MCSLWSYASLLSRTFGHRYARSAGIEQGLNGNTWLTWRSRFGKVEAHFAGLPWRYRNLYFEGRMTAFRAGKCRYALSIGQCAHQCRTCRREKAN
jgi:hypothetical protein